MNWHRIITVGSIFGAVERCSQLMRDGTYATIDDMIKEVEIHGLSLHELGWVINQFKLEQEAERMTAQIMKEESNEDLIGSGESKETAGHN